MVKQQLRSVRKAPFQNLKFLINLNKTLGLVSCKLVNGRFKQGDARDRRYCALWILLHCAYTSVSYYQRSSTVPTDDETMVYFIFSILRYTMYFLSLLPYYWVALFCSRQLVKFSDKLETYDDRVTMLGHQRKDNHILTWLYFMYTLITLTMKTYYTILPVINDGILEILINIFENVIIVVVGTYCVFITGIYLDEIYQRFSHLNNVIVPHVAQLPVTGAQGEITVYDVRYLHGVLVESAEIINYLYGCGTLVTFGSILLEFVSVIYLFLESIATDNVLVTMVDLLFQVLYLFALYHFTTMQANRVEELVIKYALVFQNAQCRMDKIETMLYFYHNKFFFTAAGFFVLDLTLLLSISTTVATLITIMI